jgi:hypothetical protein
MHEPCSLRPVLGLAVRRISLALKPPSANSSQIGRSPTTLRVPPDGPTRPPHEQLRMGDRGENFAALLKTISEQTPISAAAYLSWLKELTPAELDSIEILNGPGRWRSRSPFAKSWHRLSSASLVRRYSPFRRHRCSLLSTQYLPVSCYWKRSKKGCIPARLRLLVELLKSQTGHGVEQVIRNLALAVCHSVARGRKTTSTSSYAPRARTRELPPSRRSPKFRDLVELARTQSIADLFAEGWMENRLWACPLG